MSTVCRSSSHEHSLRISPRYTSDSLISAMTGDVALLMDATYWGKQIRSPVQFLSATRALLQQGCTAFLEIGPHPVLLASIEETAADSGL